MHTFLFQSKLYILEQYSLERRVTNLKATIVDVRLEFSLFKTRLVIRQAYVQLVSV